MADKPADISDMRHATPGIKFGLKQISQAAILTYGIKQIPLAVPSEIETASKHLLLLFYEDHFRTNYSNPTGLIVYDNLTSFRHDTVPRLSAV